MIGGGKGEIIDNYDWSRSVPRLVLEDVVTRDKHWQALASGLNDSGCRLHQVSQGIEEMNILILNPNVVCSISHLIRQIIFRLNLN